MNIHFDFYADGDGASLVGFHIDGRLIIGDRNLFEGISASTDTLARAYIEALNTLIKTPNVGPVQPIDPIPLTPEPIPVPKPVEPPVEVMSAKPEPVEEKPVTMEDVRKALIEVRKTKGNDALRGCFSGVGASKLPDVDPKDYAALLSAAKGVLNAK